MRGSKAERKATLGRYATKVYSKIRTFNSSYDRDDYLQEAEIAYLENRDRFQILRGGKRTRMKRETFMYWYVQKYLNGLADTGDVVYQIFDNEGRYIKTLSNAQFRKQKRALERKGFTWRSVNVVERLSKRDEDATERDIPYEQKEYSLIESR